MYEKIKLVLNSLGLYYVRGEIGFMGFMCAHQAGCLKET